MRPLETLGGRVAAALDERGTDRRLIIDAARDAFLARAMRPPIRPNRAWRVATVVVGTLAVAAGSSFLFNRLKKPLQFTVDDGVGSARTWLAAPSTGPLAVRFSDGTRLRIDASSRARVVDIDHNGASIALETGVIHADVIHTNTSAWRLSAGPFTVRVTGTRFDVAWDSASEQFSIGVREGSVVVSGSFVGAECAVLDGELLRISVPHGRLDKMELGNGELGRLTEMHYPDGPHVRLARSLR